jgi:cytochrome c biogenesis protein CcmG, thiol:disulfide interchange protein DsbE
MKNKLKITVVFLLFIPFFIIFYYALKSDTKNNTQIMVGSRLPSIQLLSLFNPIQKISLPGVEKEGSYLINIWSSWCAPCRDEHPFLVKLKNEHQIKIFGINYKDKTSNALDFLSKLGDPFYYVGVDSDGSKSIEIGGYGVPETYVINSDGLIVFKHVGPINSAIYEKIVNIIK